MKIKKQGKSFNTYAAEFTWAELQAIAQAVAMEHSDPVSDEMHKGFEYFFANLPTPGESDEEKENSPDMAQDKIAAAFEPLDLELPAPDGYEPDQPHGEEPAPTDGHDIDDELPAPPER